MTFVQANVSNDPAAPLSVSPLGAESFFAYRDGVLAQGVTTVLYETTKPAVIEVLEVACSAANAGQLRLWRRKPDNTYERLDFQRSNASGPLPLVPSELNVHGCAILDIVTYNASTSSYKYVLNRPLAFPTGFRVTLQNVASTDQSVGGTILGRLLK